jgi:pimeloyl-ACP methyl ester carboxylesterase
MPEVRGLKGPPATPPAHRPRATQPNRGRYLAAAAVSALVAVTGCTHTFGSTSSGGKSGPAGTSGTVAGSVSWHSCGSGGATRCGTIQVPLDYSHPTGRKITLALTEVQATAPASKRQGILLVNPGGPGGSGTSMASFVASGMDPSVAAEYDIIGFDTRGVGASVPALHCDPSFFAKARPNYIPGSKTAEQVLINRAKAYAAGCEKRFGWLLPFMTTQNIARDMDQIRAAMGQSKLSYLGYSYGTYIGQVYATLFPQRVHRMVLDSTVNPKGIWYADNIGQDYAFQGRAVAFWQWMAKYNQLYHLGATESAVRQSWYAARNRLLAHPVKVGGVPVIGGDEFDDTMLVGGYDNGYWPQMAAALATYLHTGGTTQLTNVYEQVGKQSENEFAVYNAVECADVGWPRTWAKWDADANRVYAKAPVETWDNVWFNAACAFWPVHGPTTPMKVGAAGLPGILMLQGTGDGATPYAGAQVAHAQFPTAKMVVVQGGGNHGQSLSFPANACINGYLNRYLDTGALPSGSGPVDATCATLPDPTPSG